METDLPDPEEPNGSKVVSQFVHLSIQEFMAMSSLLTQDRQKIDEVLKERSKSGHFNMALLFLYGLAFNEENGPIKLISTNVTGDAVTRQETKNALLEGVKVSY